MPQAAIPWITLALAGAGTAYGVYSSERGRKDAEAYQKKVFDQQQAAQNKAEGRANDLFGKAEGAYNPVLDYWGKIFTGNKSQLNSILAPQLNQVKQGFSGARNSMLELAPRGGGRSSMLSNLPFEERAAQGSILQQAKPQAANELAGIGANLYGMASGMSGQNAGLLGMLGNTQNSIFHNGLLGRQNSNDNISAFGSTLADILAKFGSRTTATTQTKPFANSGGASAGKVGG